MNKKIIWIVGIVVVVGVLIFLGNRNSKTVEVSNQSIKIGADLSLTDFGASWGENELKGAQLAVKEINKNGGVLGRNLELLSQDNQTQAKGSVSAVTKLISADGVHFMLTGWNDETEPVIPIITQNKVLTITVSAGSVGITKKSPYLFATWPADEFAVKSLVTYAAHNGFHRMAVVNSIGSWENSQATSFKKFADQERISVIDQFSFQADTLDVRAYISKIKTEKPDAVFIAFTEGPLERFLTEAGEFGLNIPILYPADITTLGVPSKVSSDYLKKLVYSTYAPSKQGFVDAFKNEYGVEPGTSADTAYDAVYMLAKAIEKSGTTDTDKVRASFAPFDGASGQITFDEDRGRADAEVILMGSGGKMMSQ